LYHVDALPAAAAVPPVAALVEGARLTGPFFAAVGAELMPSSSFAAAPPPPPPLLLLKTVLVIGE
jgi:hypothetical protein